ncbi:MAG: PorT family protein [Sphingobacteriales bacterium]|nr:MAG: PorT family protein [Sphingobacteriales bacterium]
MKKCLLLLALLSAQIVSAQKFGPKSKIGYVFSTDACYRTLSASSSDVGFVASTRNSMEIPRIGFTTGVSYVYGFGHFAVETGVQYSSKGEQTNFYPLNYQMPEAGAPTEAKFIYKYNYVDVPWKLLYNFKLANVNFFVSTGASANIFINDNTIAIKRYANGSEIKSSSGSAYDYSAVNYAAIASFGVELSLLKDKARLRIEPIYRQSVTSIIDAPIKGYLYSSGINAGIFVGL